MLSLVKIISSEYNTLNQRIVKFLGLGNKDIQTAIQASPHGIDSNPVKDLIAVYGKTKEKGETVIIGYLNKSLLAEVGENRLFSTDDAGGLKTFIWLKNDGTIQMAGTGDFMVRYEEMAKVCNELKDDITTLKQVFSTWSPIAQDGGAALKGAAATWFATPLQEDITKAKIAEIKTTPYTP
jgi:hypothetical protein